MVKNAEFTRVIVCDPQNNAWPGSDVRAAMREGYIFPMELKISNYGTIFNFKQIWLRNLQNFSGRVQV